MLETIVFIPVILLGAISNSIKDLIQYYRNFFPVGGNTTSPFVVCTALPVFHDAEELIDKQYLEEEFGSLMRLCNSFR